MEVSLENLYVDIGAYTGLTEVPLCQPLKTLPVAFLSVFKYFCRFCRLHRSCLINRDVIFVLTLLPGTTNKYKFSFILGFQILTLADML